MTKTRLEAFSDGVIAILITILVLELRAPHGTTWEALRPLTPNFLTYVLSFVFLAIYWNNHHHMLHAAERVNGRILWANMHLLFWLSLVPFVTDLEALARFPVAVVCAGAKAVLDLPLTLERLETLGVPVYGVGTDRFPAFYRRDSGLPLDRRFDSVEELARAIRIHIELTGAGVVVANPIDAEHEMPWDLYEQALAGALADAEARNVRGREVTPFLLDRMRERTRGKSVFSNLALLRHNARVAAELARSLSSRRTVDPGSPGRGEQRS